MKSTRIISTLFVLVLFACSSSSSEPTGSAAGANEGKAGKKTCADLSKCCDKLGEPNKTACTAAAGAKVEDACAASYDKICTASDAGTEAGTNACPTLKEACETCSDPQLKAGCLDIVRGNDDAKCGAANDSGVFRSCSPPPAPND